MSFNPKMAILIFLVLGLLLIRRAVAQPKPEVEVSQETVKNVLRYRDLINLYARSEGLDPALVAAIIHWESGGDPEATEPKNGIPLSYGLMQLNYLTALDMGMPRGLEPKALFDPATNIKYGTKYLRWLLNKYDGDLDYSLSAYNQGPGNLAKYGITNWKYINGVKALWERYKKLLLSRTSRGAGREF